MASQKFSLKILSVCVGMAIGGNAAAIPTTDGLVAYYSFEGDASDSSGYGNDGTSHDGVSYLNDGIKGQYASYDGTSGYITADGGGELALESWTISTWLKPTSWTHSQPVAKAENSSTRYNYAIALTGGTGQIRSQYETASSDFDHTLWGPSLSLNDWSHVVSTRDSDGTHSLYVNGELVSQNTYADTPAQNNETLVLGGNVGLNTNPAAFLDHLYEGGMDETRIYNRALDDSEIRELSKEGNIDPWLVAHYEFEGDATDSSDNEYHGTALGGVDLNAEGIIGSAADFDGINDYIQTAPINETWDSWTVSFFVKPDESTESGYQVIVERERIGSYNDLEIGITTDSKLSVETDAASVHTVHSQELINDSVWQHVAVTYDGETEKVYIDGALDSSRAQSNAMVNVAEELLIGRHASTSFPSYFDGSIDDLRIYSGALDADEISEIYALGEAYTNLVEIINESEHVYTFHGTITEAIGGHLYGDTGFDIGDSFSVEYYAADKYLYSVIEDGEFATVGSITTTVDGDTIIQTADNALTIDLAYSSVRLNDTVNLDLSGSVISSHSIEFSGYDGEGFVQFIREGDETNRPAHQTISIHTGRLDSFDLEVKAREITSRQLQTITNSLQESMFSFTRNLARSGSEQLIETSSLISFLGIFFGQDTTAAEVAGSLGEITLECSNLPIQEINYDNCVYDFISNSPSLMVVQGSAIPNLDSLVGLSFEYMATGLDGNDFISVAINDELRYLINGEDISDNWLLSDIIDISGMTSSDILTFGLLTVDDNLTLHMRNINYHYSESIPVPGTILLVFLGLLVLAIGKRIR